MKITFAGSDKCGIVYEIHVYRKVMSATRYKPGWLLP